MKKTIVSTNWLNKVIAAAMMMAITTMPAMAGNNKKNHNRKNDKVVVVINNDKKVSHFDRADKRTSRFAAHRHAYRPDVKACTFRVSRYDSHRMAAAKAERIKGVMDTKWNPRTREITVIYDAKVTSPRHIRHFMA
jgi:ribulose-5-phosphate 4-epimerase/fuculose-1-phosphate aldolase